MGEAMKLRAVLVVFVGALVACGDNPVAVHSAAPSRPPVSALPPAVPPGLDTAARVLPAPPAPPVITAEQAASAAEVVDQAQPEERVAEVLTLTGGTTFVTPAPAAIKARTNAAAAHRAALAPGDASPSMKAKTPKAQFGLFTDQSGDLQADNSVSRRYVNVPVWVITWTDEDVMANRGQLTQGPPVEVGTVVTVKESAAPPAPPRSLSRATVRYIIDDITGRPLKSVTEAVAQ